MKKHSDFNLEEFDDLRPEDIPGIINAMDSQPFLAEKRLIVIRGLPYPAKNKQTDEDMDRAEDDSPEIRLEEPLKNLPESSLVIFVSPNPDKRLRFFKFLSKLALTENFPLLSGHELSVWAEQRLRTAGKRISRRALDLLLLYCAEDNSRVANELDKLSLLDKQELDEADIDKFVSPTPEAKIFKSLDMIGKIGSKQILNSFQNLVRSGESLMLIFFMIVRQFRLLLQAKYLLEKNAGRAGIQKRLKLAPFQINMLLKQAEYFSFSSLSATYQELIRLDCEIKTGKIPSSGANEELLHLKIDQLLCRLYE